MAYEIMTDNTQSYEDLGWFLEKSEKGFCLLVTRPRMQNEVASHFHSPDVTVYNYAHQGVSHFYFADVERLVKENPNSKSFFMVQFQQAVSDEIDKLRFNFSRERLDGLERNFIFCVTEEAADGLNQKARDIYSWMKLKIPFEDETEALDKVLEITDIVVPPIDKDTGVEVQIDDSWTDERKLAAAIAMKNRAERLRDEGRYADAQKLLEYVVEIREAILGTEHPDTAKAYDRIADVYELRGDYCSALEYDKKALAIRERALGKNNLETAETYNNMAGVYSDQGDYEKALEYYGKALAIKERVLGTEHPSTAVTYNNMASVYSAQGDYEKALEYCGKALAIRVRVLGTDHPDTKKTRNLMTQLLQKTN